MSRVKKILVVCTGNSCRSVMAGAFLKKLLEEKSDYQVRTAGIAAVDGMRASFEAMEVMSAQDIDVSGHRSSSLRDDMIEQSDLILVMTRMHKEYILTRAPGAREKVHLLNEYGRPEQEHEPVNPDVPDPIGRPLEFYRQVFDVIRESLKRVVKKLEEE